CYPVLSQALLNNPCFFRIRNIVCARQFPSGRLDAFLDLGFGRTVAIELPGQEPQRLNAFLDEGFSRTDLVAQAGTALADWRKAASAAFWRIKSAKRGIFPRWPSRSTKYSQKFTPCFRQVFFRLAKVSRQRRPAS